MGRILLSICGFICVIIIAAGATLLRPNIPHEKLKQKYAVSASKFIEFEDGTTVHYLDSGPIDGSGTLLLLHDFASSAFEWRPWINEIRGRYRIIAIDLPSHGLTTNSLSYIHKSQGHLEFLSSFVEKFELERFAIGGSGLGGKMSLDYTAAYPEKIEAVVLIGPNGWSQSVEEASFDPLLREFRRYPLLSPLLKWIDLKPFINVKIDRGFANDHAERQKLIDSLSEFARIKGHRRGLELQSRTLATDMQPTYKLNKPILILRGDRDNISPARFSVQLNKNTPQSTMITYEMLGHFLHIESPKRSLNDVLYFLTDTKLALSQNTDQSLETNRAISQETELTQTPVD